MDLACFQRKSEAFWLWIWYGCFLRIREISESGSSWIRKDQVRCQSNSCFSSAEGILGGRERIWGHNQSFVSVHELWQAVWICARDEFLGCYSCLSLWAWNCILAFHYSFRRILAEEELYWWVLRILWAICNTQRSSLNSQRRALWSPLRLRSNHGDVHSRANHGSLHQCHPPTILCKVHPI